MAAIIIIISISLSAVLPDHAMGLYEKPVLSYKAFLLNILEIIKTYM